MLKWGNENIKKTTVYNDMTDWIMVEWRKRHYFRSLALLRVLQNMLLRKGYRHTLVCKTMIDLIDSLPSKF